MSKKKITLNEKTEKLAEKYLEVTKTDMSDLVNKALQAFLIDHLSSNQVKDALQDTDSNSSASIKYSEHLFNSNIEDLNRY
ncbi:hypothetical protein OZY43_07815 [Lactobacillus sp. ESL0785]|uniref:hypothetical protein n=1 Tax=Lactobacillus sp. ESL0785 TaxID=2983232 RepID=UPI0023F7F774|nr:hypothetical protein [Lactobacillus sp. ESL0785]WEV70831.1 hypothetical protein OZY43_07815 [Lactobacillus sp. ESL0785]